MPCCWPFVLTDLAQLGLQTLATAFLDAAESESGTLSQLPRAAIVTSLAANALLPPLQGAFRAQSVGRGRAPDDTARILRDSLRQISISRVFDFEGLWEVLCEIEEQSVNPNPSPTAPKPVPEAAPISRPGERRGIPHAEPSREAVASRTEIEDSEDESDLSTPPQPTSPGPLLSQERPVPAPENALRPTPLAPLAVVLVTGFTAHLRSVFGQGDGRSDGRSRSSSNKAMAHATVQGLGRQLRQVARATGGVVLLLNATTTTASSVSGPVKHPAQPETAQADPTLRSVFDPATTSPTTTGSVVSGPQAYGYVTRPRTATDPSTAIPRPSFGHIFAQIPDLHLLCTRLPRQDGSEGGGRAATAWAVEVLRDELGAWLSDSGLPHEPQRPQSRTTRPGDEAPIRPRDGTPVLVRPSRERRWGLVDVVERRAPSLSSAAGRGTMVAVGDAIVDAPEIAEVQAQVRLNLERRRRQVAEGTRVVGGFGGPSSRRL